jgi:hypothetical protein
MYVEYLHTQILHLSMYRTTINKVRGCHGCVHMVVGLTTTYGISAYHH